MRNFEVWIEKGLSESEKAAAIKHCDWFIGEAFSGKSHYNHEKNEWLHGAKIPSWKHLTRGGWVDSESNGKIYPIQRGRKGRRIENTDLFFRRISQSKRVFGVVREVHLKPKPCCGNKERFCKKCICSMCEGGSKVTMEAVPLDMYFTCELREL